MNDVLESYNDTEKIIYKLNVIILKNINFFNRINRNPCRHRILRQLLLQRLHQQLHRKQQRNQQQQQNHRQLDQRRGNQIRFPLDPYLLEPWRKHQPRPIIKNGLNTNK